MASSPDEVNKRSLEFEFVFFIFSLSLLFITSLGTLLNTRKIFLFMFQSIITFLSSKYWKYPWHGSSRFRKLSEFILQTAFKDIPTIISSIFSDWLSEKLGKKLKSEIAENKIFFLNSFIKAHYSNTFSI